MLVYKLELYAKTPYSNNKRNFFFQPSSDIISKRACHVSHHAYICCWAGFIVRTRRFQLVLYSLLLIMSFKLRLSIGTIISYSARIFKAMILHSCNTRIRDNTSHSAYRIEGSFGLNRGCECIARLLHLILYCSMYPTHPYSYLAGRSAGRCHALTTSWYKTSWTLRT